VQSLTDGCGKISQPQTDVSPTHSSNTFPSPVSIGTEICFGLRLANPALGVLDQASACFHQLLPQVRERPVVDSLGSTSHRHRFPRLPANKLSPSRTSLDRERWQLSRVIFTACLPSLIHCSAMPRLLYVRRSSHNSTGLGVLRNSRPEKGRLPPQRFWAFSSSPFLPTFSIFFGQQNAGRRTVGFRDYPELVTRAGTVGAQEPKALLQTELVFLDVFRRNFSPIATDVASKEVPRLLAGFFNRSQRTGGECVTKLEEGLCALVFAASAA
jgi:hypothetical protein